MYCSVNEHQLLSCEERVMGRAPHGLILAGLLFSCGINRRESVDNVTVSWSHRESITVTGNNWRKQRATNPCGLVEILLWGHDGRASGQEIRSYRSVWESMKRTLVGTYCNTGFGSHQEIYIFSIAGDGTVVQSRTRVLNSGPQGNFLFCSGME